MCFDQTTSLITFSISVICFSYLLHYSIVNNNKYDIIAATYVILIGLMQLIEYFLWKYQKPSLINHIFSLLIIFVLFLQQFIGSLVFMYLFPNLYPIIVKNIVKALLVVFTAFTIYLLNWLNKQNLFSTPEKQSCRLAWAPFTVLSKTNFSRFLFLTFLFFYFVIGGYSFGIFSLFYGKIFEGFIKYPIRFSVLPLTFLLTFFICFFVDKGNFIDIWGSYWCFAAVAFGIISCLHI
jgi:hypothetical protein